MIKLLGKNNDLRTEDGVITKWGYLVAAICAAPSILGKRGLLDGHKACCFPGFEEELKGADVIMDKKVLLGLVLACVCGVLPSPLGRAF